MSIMYFSPAFAAAMTACAFVLGAVMASFINCMQIRLTEKKPVFGRSCCPNCGHKLSWYELVPVLSYIFLKGKCKSCKQRISPRYLIVEVLFGLMYAGLLWGFGLSAELAEYVILFTILAAEAIWDYATFEVPDTLHILAIINWLAFLWAHGPLERLKSGLFAGVIYAGAILLVSLVADKVYKKESIGGADIKLIFVLGLYFGWKAMLLLIILSCVTGLLLALAFRAGMQKAFPFIPALVLSAYICAFAAEPIIRWYTSLFGLGEHIH